jgi:hypothetical protein
MTWAPVASALRRVIAAMGGRAITAPATSGPAPITGPRSKNNGAPSSDLATERDRLIRQRANLSRQHRAVCSIDDRLRWITAEMLRQEVGRG